MNFIRSRDPPRIPTKSRNRISGPHAGFFPHLLLQLTPGRTVILEWWQLSHFFDDPLAFNLLAYLPTCLPTYCHTACQEARVNVGYVATLNIPKLWLLSVLQDYLFLSYGRSSLGLWADLGNPGFLASRFHSPDAVDIHLMDIYRERDTLIKVIMIRSNMINTYWYIVIHWHGHNDHNDFIMSDHLTLRH